MSFAFAPCGVTVQPSRYWNYWHWVILPSCLWSTWNVCRWVGLPEVRFFHVEQRPGAKEQPESLSWRGLSISFPPSLRKRERRSAGLRVARAQMHALYWWKYFEIVHLWAVTSFNTWKSQLTLFDTRAWGRNLSQCCCVLPHTVSLWRWGRPHLLVTGLGTKLAEALQSKTRARGLLLVTAVIGENTFLYALLVF